MGWRGVILLNMCCLCKHYLTCVTSASSCTRCLLPVLRDRQQQKQLAETPACRGLQAQGSIVAGLAEARQMSTAEVETAH